MSSFSLTLKVTQVYVTEPTQPSLLSNYQIINIYSKNSLAVKKGVALFKMASVKKVVKSKGAAKKWL